jgi:hypothetical protein
MNNVNPSALLRSLIVYAICVPVAILVGYMLTNPLDYQSMGFIVVLSAILVFPLLMKWHYPLLIFSWSLPVTLFFVPAHPNIFLAMVAISLTISVVERVLDRNQPFLPTGGVAWPLLAMLVLIVLTAKLTGGFGLRSMGSDVYGGKKYVFLIVGILSFFAITARPIPRKYAKLYITLYFMGGFFAFISDLYAYTPSFLHFIYLVFPPSGNGMDQFGNQQVTFGVTRLGGIASAATAVFSWMLARHGFRDNFITGKIWRPLLLGLMFILVFLGGFRSDILEIALILGLLFYLEKMHRTGAMLAVLMLCMAGGAILVPAASHLPRTFQRALAFLPLDISPEVRMDAEGSTEWRVEMWKALLPEVPKYLLLGKGYAFSQETFNESMGADATFHTTIDAADNPLALSSDFHSGPLSLVLPFGIWAVLLWLWYWAAGFLVVWRNYRYGDPSLRHINVFLYAVFLAKCFSFIFVFGSFVDDVGHFAGIIGLSIALNHGVMRRGATPSFVAAPKDPSNRRPFPTRPPYPALAK